MTAAERELRSDLGQLNRAFRVWQERRDDISFDMLLLAHGAVFGVGGSFHEWDAARQEQTDSQAERDT
jgi:hypothetical protein